MDWGLEGVKNKNKHRIWREGSAVKRTAVLPEERRTVGAGPLRLASLDDTALTCTHLYTDTCAYI